MMQTAKSLAVAFLLTALALVNFQAFSQDDKAPNDIQTKKNPVASSDAVLAKAKAVYEENCLMCHGEAGKGDGPMASMLKEKPADISDAKIIGEFTDGEIFWLITKGKKPMPNFENKLSEEERWSLVHLMRSMSKTKPNNTPH
jgi:mono/diheme cytochrome c family protein